MRVEVKSPVTYTLHSPAVVMFALPKQTVSSRLVGSRLVVALLAVMNVCSLTVQTAGEETDRPPEGTLPAYLLASPSDLVFPSESLLPDGFAPLRAQRIATIAQPAFEPREQLPSEQLPSEQLPSEQLPSEQLPSESQLPAESPNSQVDLAGNDPAVANQADLARILDESRDRMPWLRLIEAEHTSPIRTVEFDSSGRNLFTAGEDKLVHHWRLGAGERPQWQHQATYRWQVQRAELGTVLSLSTYQNQLFMAGFGAEGQQGEIVALNTQTGAWLAPIVDKEQGHFSPVLNVKSFPAAQPRRIVSSDQKRGIAVWRQDPNLGTWTHKWLREPLADAKVLFSPLDISGNQTIVTASRSMPWSIELIDVETTRVTQRYRRNALLSSPAAMARAIQTAQAHFLSQGQRFRAEQLEPIIRDFYGTQVTAVAAAPQAKFIAAADDAGILYVWNQAGQLLLKDVASFNGFLIETIRFSDDLRYMATAATNNRSSQSIVHVWRMELNATPSLERELDLDGMVRGIALAPDGRSLVVGHGRRVEVLLTEQETPPQVLPAHETIVQASRVVFADELPFRWQLQWPGAKANFDGEQMNWLDGNESITWHETPAGNQRFAQHGWSLDRQPQDGQALDGRASSVPAQEWVLRGDQPIGRLDLDRHYQARPNSGVEQLAWVQAASGELAGVAISLNDQNDIWYFSAPRDQTGVLPLRRVFRGHEGRVRSIDISPDARYLISCAEDSTVRLWPLVGLVGEAAPMSAPRSTWGFEFEIVNGSVVAQNPIFTGPLQVKGLRAGDQLTEISYETHDAGGRLQRTTIRDPQQMIDFLAEERFDLAIRFVIQRAGAPAPGFQAYAHWRELAAQVIATDREWAVWTPTGHYDASFNGNRLFGWQINRGLEQEPDFYRADRFQAALERPDLMRKLLASGSIEEAARLAANRAIDFGLVLQNAIDLQPRVTILSPTQVRFDDGRQAEILAEIRLQSGQRLASSKAFVSGVAAKILPDRQQATLDDGTQLIQLRWSAALPSDSRLQFQVVCSTQERLVGSDTVLIARQRPLEPRSKPRLHLISAGISKYQDSRIPSLENGANNAAEFMRSLVLAASSKYDVRPLLLVDSSLTSDVWRSTLAQMESHLGDVQADDIVMLFLSGHGLVDAESGQYFFVTANAKYHDLARQNYQACLGFNELFNWNEVPCRKVAILDTCHSGAIQSLDTQHLKAAVRALQADMVLTLTASEGNQLAAEYRGAQASLFTEVITEALRITGCGW